MAASAVLDDDDDDYGGAGAGAGGGGSGSSTVTQPREGEEEGEILASSSLRVWPSVSDSDEEDHEGKAVGKKDSEEGGGRIAHPEVYGSSGEEVLELVEGDGRGRSEVGDRVLGEVGEVLTSEEAEVLRGRLARSGAVEEGEYSSGSVVSSSGRGGEGVYVTEELPDDWLGVEEASSSVGEEEGRAGVEVNSGDVGAKWVSKREEETGAGSQILASPVGIAIGLVGFQMKLIVQMLSFALWFCSFAVSVMTFPFRASLTATNVAVATAVDGYTLATQVKPMVEQGVAQAGPVLRRTAKRCGFGFVASVYVMFMLGCLSVPALVFELWFVRGFIEEPVEFRQALHFDYRQERPSVTMYLLPRSVLAKVEGDVYPTKVLRARAIPPSHKLQVTAFLTLPESHYNRDLGMFQVTAELLSVRGQVLKRTSWPCMLRFQSNSIRYAKQLILGVPLLMGLSGESQKIALRLYENEQEMKTPTAMVRFILEPKAGYPIGEGLPQVYSAEAQVLSVLPWTKDILRRWKWTFYVWSALSTFMFELMVVLCCCHQVLLPSSLLGGMTEGFRESESTAVVEDTPVRRVGKHGRRVNFSDELPTARPVRVPSKPHDKEKDRELLLGSAESSSTITGPRLRRLPTPTSINADMASSEATSSWSIPPLDYVGGKVEAVEGRVRRLGKAVVDGASEGVDEALDRVAPVLDSKPLKSDSWELYSTPACGTSEMDM